MGSEVADRVVAPVVAEATTEQRRFADELMNRHELHGGDAEGLEVLYGRGVSETGVRSANLGRHAWMPHGEAAYMQFVDDSVGPCRVRTAMVLAPGEVVVHDDGLGDVGRRVAMILHGVITSGREAEDCIVGDELAVEGARVRVGQEFARVPPGTASRVEGAVDAEAVALSGAD